MNRYATIGIVFDYYMQHNIMIERNKRPYKGLLNGIGGRIEDGETAIQGMYREIKEEIGVDRANIDDMYHAMSVTYPSGWALEVFYVRLLFCAKPTIGPTREGIVQVVKSEEVLNIKDPRWAGDGNLTYYVFDALRRWGVV